MHINECLSLILSTIYQKMSRTITAYYYTCNHAYCSITRARNKTMRQQSVYKKYSPIKNTSLVSSYHRVRTANIRRDHEKAKRERIKNK